MSAIAAANLAILAQWANPTTGKLARVGQASIPLASPTQDDWESLFETIVTSLQELNTAVDAADGNFADPVATIAALQAVAAADRQDKQIRVVEDNGLGQRSLYIFDSASSATGDDLSVVAPTAGSGRWFAAAALPFGFIPVINASGSPVTKGQPVSVFSSSGSRIGISAASATGSAPPIGLAAAAIADGAVGLVCQFGPLTNLTLNTSGASLGDPVYLDANGALSLTAPADTGLGSYVVGVVSALSATGSVFCFPPVTLRAPGIARGVATMGSAATTETVAVGTRYNGKKALVSFAGDPGAASVLWAVPVTAGDLVIHVDGAPGADVDIVWSIIFDQ